MLCGTPFTENCMFGIGVFCHKFGFIFNHILEGKDFVETCFPFIKSHPGTYPTQSGIFVKPPTNKEYFEALPRVLSRSTL